jgi:hypothetical protein
VEEDMGIISSPSVTDVAAATGWYAQFKTGGDKAVAFWAFSKTTQSLTVTGFVAAASGGAFENAEAMSGFKGYIYIPWLKTAAHEAPR